MSSSPGTGVIVSSVPLAEIIWHKRRVLLFGSVEMGMQLLHMKSIPA